MTLMDSKKKSRLNKYDFIMAIAKKFPNKIATRRALLAVEAMPLDQIAYCALTPDKQLVWEERGNELNKTMLY